MNPLITMRGVSKRPVARRTRSKMRIISSVVLVTVGILLGPGLLHLSAADDDGVALGILYDTSGSMNDSVADSHGASSPKYVVANRALLAVVKQIQDFTTNGVTGTPRKVDVGLFIFNQSGAQEVVKLGPFDPDAIQKWAKGFSKPNGGTPLGNALRTVSQAVIDS